MHLEVRHLKLLVAINEVKTLTKASNRLNLTQSALSHQLKFIESRLGTALFFRVDKKLIITPAGERLLATAQKVLDELRRVEEDIQSIAAKRKGILRISTQCYTCYNWLPDLLTLFHKKHPAVEVDIVVDATRNPIQFLLDGKLDLAIVNKKVRDRRVRFIPLFKDELVVIMQPGHRLAEKSFIRPDDFADEKLIIHNTPQENIIFQNLLAPSGITPKHTLQVQLTDAVVEMVKAGLGIGVMARWAVREQVKAGAVKAVRLTQRGFQREWSAAIIKTKQAQPYLTKFSELLSENSGHISGSTD
jgi:LysR family transcriptional regulator for metE and metH